MAISSENRSNSKGKQPQGKRRTSPVRTMARPDEWAVDMGLRVDGHPFTLEGREYIRDVIRDYSPEIVIPKAAQTAYTVTAIVKSLHNVTERGLNGLYLLPLKAGAVPFVQARVDPIIASCDELKRKFASVDNRLHKQSSDGQNLYFRGTNIERELQEVPVDFIMMDERDRMVDEWLDDARHRMDGSKWKRLISLSTPTVEGHGIYADDGWDSSDQHRWEVPCPGCNRFQTLSFGENEMEYNSLKLGDDENDCVLECVYCSRELKDEDRWGLNKLGRWVPYNLDGRIRGYYINQFSSPTQSLAEIMKDYFAGQRNVRKLRSFWRQNMGKPFAAPGDRLTPEMLDKCREKGYTLGGIPSSSIALGIDIGNFIHVWCYMVVRGMKYLWQIKRFREWGELDKFLSKLGSWVGVIDAHPEKRAARDLCLKYHGKLFLGFEQDRDQQGEIATFSKREKGKAPEVKIDRTLAFDTVISDVMDGQVRLPMNIREEGERMPKKDYNGVYHQLIQQVRIEEENTKGIMIARWRKNKNADHWHHAMMFATIACLQKPRLQVPKGLTSAMNKNLIAA